MRPILYLIQLLSVVLFKWPSIGSIFNPTRQMFHVQSSKLSHLRERDAITLLRQSKNLKDQVGPAIFSDNGLENIILDE